MDPPGKTPAYRDSVRWSLDKLMACGVFISDGFRESVEAELKTPPRSIGAAPWCSIVLWLSEWHTEIVHQKHLTKLAGGIIALIERQQQWGSCWTRDTRVRILRVARRLFMLAARGDYDGDWELLASRLLKIRLLPGSPCLPQTPDRPVSFSTINQFVTDAVKLAERRPVVSPANCPEHSRSTNNKPPSVLAPNCPDDFLRPTLAVALKLGLEATESFVGGNARFLALVLLESLYGMHFKDALCLRLGDCDSMICPGRLSRDSLILHVGNGFFSGSACWDESKLTLPLIPQLTALLDQTGIDFSRRCSLGEAFGSTTADEYRRGVCDLREKTNGGAKTKQESFQASFDFAALVECRTEPAVLSLLRGKPLYGSRGRCAYVARTGSQLRRTSMEIQSRVLEMCGMAGHSMPLSASDPDEELHGTPSDSFEVLVEQFAGAVESATTHNAIIRCVQHLMLLLGMRRTGTHPNPAWFLRRLCGDTLCFSDKRWVEGQAHHLPCGADLLEVTSQCARIFGASKILLFEIDGKYVSSLDAPDASRIPFPSGYPFQPYRNALINKLIDHEVPTIVIDYVVGHNSGGISPTSGALPITEADLLLAASKAMDMVQCCPIGA